MTKTLNQRKGRYAETLALNYLRMRGLRLITRNYLCKGGEIDLVMSGASALHRELLIFVEVRYRSSQRFGGALASISHKKQQRIIHAAQHFLHSDPQFKSWPTRFDVVAVTSRALRPSIDWRPSAFQL